MQLPPVSSPTDAEATTGANIAALGDVRHAVQADLRCHDTSTKNSSRVECTGWATGGVFTVQVTNESNRTRCVPGTGSPMAWVELSLPLLDWSDADATGAAARNASVEIVYTLDFRANSAARQDTGAKYTYKTPVPLFCSTLITAWLRPAMPRGRRLQQLQYPRSTFRFVRQDVNATG